jgi:hypothetical protein
VSQLRVQIARTPADVAELRGVWEEVPWQGVEASYHQFAARARDLEEPENPFAVLVFDESRPVAGLAGVLRTEQLKTRFGFRVVYAPAVRMLQVLPGGLAASSAEGLSRLSDVLADLMRSGQVEVAQLPSLPVTSSEYAVFSTSGPYFDRPRFVHNWERQRLVLPPSFDDFLRSRSYETRRGVKKNANRARAALGERVRINAFNDSDQYDQAVSDLEQIASRSYLKDVGGGFKNTQQQRNLLRAGLESGNYVVYVLYDGDRPVTYWLCATYRGTLETRLTGYDPDYGKLRLGVYLLMRVIEDACADPNLNLIDFGPGTFEYKLHYCSESRLEGYLRLFAPTGRMRMVNGMYTTVTGASRLVRRILDALKLTDRIKASRNVG